MAYSKVNI